MSTRKKTTVSAAGNKSPAADKETYWTRLDKVLGAFTMSSLSKAARIGVGTLHNARKRGGPPNLAVTVAICKVLDIQPAVLLGKDTPPALQPQLAITPPATADAGLRRIPLANLTRSHLNPRRTFNDAETAELAEGIFQQGLLQNLVARQDPDQPAIYWVVAGERRLHAMQKLAAEKRLPADLAEHGIPVRVIAGDDEEHIILALIENLQRVDPNPMEEAEALARLQSMNPKKWSTAILAERLGVSVITVQRRLKIARSLIPEVKESLRAGAISLQQAKVLSTLSSESQAELLTEAVEGTPASELARSASHDMFPAVHALFDIAASGLETWEDAENGDLFITDFDAAFALQTKVVEAKRTELLQAGRPWVDIKDWVNDYNYPKGGQGVVIALSPHNGKVEILPDRNRRDATPELADDDENENDYAAREAAEDRYRQEHLAASDELMQALADGITHAEARAIILWNALNSNALAVPMTYARPHKTIEDLAGLIGLNGVKPSEQSRVLAAWQSLLGQKEGRVQNALVAQVTRSLERPRMAQPLHPILRALATTLSHKVPAILLDDAAARTARVARYASGQSDIEDLKAAA